MAKKPPIRVASVGERVASLIDCGCEIDRQLKNLKTEDVGTKKIITDEAEKLLQKGELAIRLDGIKATATINVAEKYELNASSEKFPLVEPAIKSGIFGDAIEIIKSLAIPSDKIDEACELLKKAGINAMVQVVHNINAEEFRVLIGSVQSTPERSEIVANLKECVVRQGIMKVTYQKKD
jgi:hypothetical protein